ncbi:hypothetical protein ASU31_17600 [Pedobacter ginsenosidimutans]|uniref:Uncharacterized protein n=1 Tax=Pedobacter ginsenosidimutans TaxID=687842 RepID=A0A0T5VM52_9SPHI|nr:hypothetical protein [Pedobacter ginsenosidimutans]KRT14719.1 hypothetical protein ASU31_17600 [Pedobacter ginsenosidimutans]
MNIKTIEITNIKGIGHKLFTLDLAANRPNILVAPNGFGKSSFAIGFDSLRNNKIELDDKNYYLKDANNRPILTLTLTTGQTLVADDTQNTISDYFDVFVINNQTEPKSVVQKIPGRPAFAKTSLDIMPTTLIQTIPPKIYFDYNSSTMKSTFGENGGKLLNNISNLFNCGHLFFRIESEIDFTRFDLKSYQQTFDSAFPAINRQNGTGNSIRGWIQSNILPSFQALDEFRKLVDIITSFGFVEVKDEVNAYFTAWQILSVKDRMGINFKKACKYLYYLDEKDDFTKTIESFNPVKDRFDIKPKVEGSSLVVRWPKAHEISNGQRDILTFIALLLKSRRNFKKKDCILIIDEIFDYMDDANLITFQYYVSTFIDEMKRQKRRIFPILLTHLDPLFFNHFCFNDAKIKVGYLKEPNVKSNQNILKIIYKRDDLSIKDQVDAYYFHYHPTINAIDLEHEFKALKLNVDWAKPEKFFQKVFREVRRYLFEKSAFDPLAICFGVRIQIEKLVYDLIPDPANKTKFINTNGSKNKLHFAQNIGIHIPETYFLLGIIYNTSLHLTEGHDISKPLGLKLENGTIKQMIKNLFT